MRHPAGTIDSLLQRVSFRRGDIIMSQKLKKVSGSQKKKTSALAAAPPPPTWYFPTSSPGVVIACDYNPADDRYNLNCRQMPIGQIPQPQQAAVKRTITVFANSFGV
jgi:hypothetical protein